MPVDDIGVLHTSITLYAQWGKVEVSNGLILDSENRKAILTPIIKTEGNTITGDGWILHLKDGWEISKEQGWMEVKLK
ncbi:hypothetical protein LJC30_03870 [Odoribacter sp. OttesenSCG-928-L07]|nr:hypothetical protein [Odoribacter sp. OttesenSCG-928-L07]MDL2239477.1 hypothetical protein [Bacteroidales bacterium OttesenSCG-928-L14]